MRHDAESSSGQARWSHKPELLTEHGGSNPPSAKIKTRRRHDNIFKND